MSKTDEKKRSMTQKIMDELQYRPWTVMITMLVIAALYPIVEKSIGSLLWLGFVLSIGALALWFLRGRPNKPSKK